MDEANRARMARLQEKKAKAAKATKAKVAKPPRVGPRKASKSPSKVKAKVYGVEAKEATWGNLPHGWTQDSVMKFWSTLTGDAQHKLTQCHDKIDGHVSNPWAFCGSLGSHVGYKPVRKKQSEAAVSTGFPQLMRTKQ